MRRNSVIEDIWHSGEFFGLNAATSWVTVAPHWMLYEGRAPGSSMSSRRQPARYYTDAANTVLNEIDVPPKILKRIRIDRQRGADCAQLTITLRNADPEGGPNRKEQGRYSQRRSIGAVMVADGSARWPELEANDWSNVYTVDRAHGYGYLAQGNMIRTYQGYGGWEAGGPEGRQLKPRLEAIADGNIVMTGCWIVDDVNYDTQGNIEVTARDVFALLVDQKLYPPLVPTGCYPTQFFSRTWNVESGYGPHGKSPSSTNYRDLADPIRLFALWAGFYLPGSAVSADGRWPGILGGIEDTGIDSPSVLDAAMFDKKDIVEGMKEIAKIVGYDMWADQEGGFRFQSPNIWEAGNFDYDGVHDRFAFDIDESRELINFKALGSKKYDRSSITAAMTDPYRSATGDRGKIAAFDTWTSSTKNQLHGMISPAIIAIEKDIPLSEMVTMAELTGLRTWFERRRGTVEAPALPLIDQGDQVRIWERITFDHFLHLVDAVSTEHDCDTGVYRMNLTTHWMGADNANWAIRVGPGGHIVYNTDASAGGWSGTTPRGGGHVQHPTLVPTRVDTLPRPWTP